MTSNTCNGYSNWETWTVATWLDQENMTEYLEFLAGEFSFGGFVEEIKVTIESKNPLSTDDSLYSIFLSESLRQVNYEEIARNIRDEALLQSEDDLQERINDIDSAMLANAR